MYRNRTENLFLPWWLSMNRRIFCALAVCVLGVGSVSAQTIRFDTNVGTFDVKLNPTGNPFLQGHVDNMIAYVEAGRYDVTVINRAATNFVLQMGGFQAPFLTAPEDFDAFPEVPKFDSVVVDENGDRQVDFDLGDLTNNRGTVTLALASNQPNSGTSSFFVNLADTNTFLDNSGFVPFAEISNLETINLIMALPQISLDPTDQNLAAINVPILENNKLVIIERAFVLDATDEMIQSALANATIDANTALPLLSDDLPLNDPTGNLMVPEPSSLVLGGAMAMLAAFKRRRAS
jgi:cyclophilin family peptidyl-prolyl cis-trans isomerase